MGSKPLRIIFACDRAGKYQSKGKNPAVYKSKQRKRTGSKKCECLIKVELRLDHLLSQWMLYILKGAHNHSPSIAATAYPVHRTATITPNIHTEILRLLQSGLSLTQILIALRVSDP